ncbi:CTD kinase subunit gamma CTK3-domain-containing protein [Halteromyces radiatus]|uniref:CTD kinase subunit gamma CTK3-domain-containing protein n=1 Tax=Halteromyces radiatus TaxID=101107 RepID=UPI00221FDCE6|nr:CTD kinase subunit gamma CTK3-domain-containing protein [Halteromyces radiatus]KAI8086593.1 CTD kinase subunit gamma CTK3-domain-containing protein [Halteromyces radiatus]
MSEDLDPFECRLQFISLLKKLNASQQSIQKTARYAVRHRQLSEDLYSCFLEEIENTSLNARLNLLYVLDCIFSMSRKVQFMGYIDLTQPNVLRIINAVALSSSKGIVNVSSTRKLLSHWKEKQYFDNETIETAQQALISYGDSLSQTKRQDNGNVFTKADILNRMEQDRERHKRLREEMWRRSTEESSDADFEQLWQTTDGFDAKIDGPDLMQQNKLYLPHYPWDSLLL